VAAAERNIPPVRGRPWEGKLVERVCFLARVRPERLDEYRERHRHVPPVFRGARGVVPPEPAEPDMRAALREAGWGNYAIAAATEVNKRWQAEMAGFFMAEGADVLPDQSFQRLSEVFHLDEEYTPNA
jgi:L-rhamnose mutarotase